MDRKKKPAFSCACVCQLNSRAPVFTEHGNSPGVVCNRVLVAFGTKPADGGKCACWAEPTFFGLDRLDAVSYRLTKLLLQQYCDTTG